jgi:hypothetical protein
MSKFRYKNPPIVERVIGVYHQIPQDEFEKRLPAWEEKIRADFPRRQEVAEWLINIEEKNGVPMVQSLIPKASIIHLYWQKHLHRARVLGMRVRPDRLVFHLCREDGNIHDFDELMPNMERWLPQWAEHFGVTDLEGISVEYYNRLDGNITPQFADQNGVRIAEALNVFANFSGSHLGLIPPYECKVRLVFNKDKPTYLTVRVGNDSNITNAIRVDFSVHTGNPGRDAKTLTFGDAISEIRTGHDLILEQFSSFFTDRARVSFEPL